MVLGPLHGDGGHDKNTPPRADRRGLTLVEARAEAAKAMELLKRGIDPIDARRELKTANAQAKVLAAADAAKVKTFEQAAQEYFDAKSDQWTNLQHRGKFLSSLKMYVFPKIGKLPVETINTDRLREVLEPIWRTKNSTADRVRNRIENILNYAIALGIRSDNPARWVVLSNVLSAKTKDTQHHRALSHKEIPTFVAKLAEVRGEALEFLILTAARSGEVIGARWEEIELRAVPVTVRAENGDEDSIMGPVWIIPKERMKEKKEHRVPLSDRAVEILNGLPREGDADDGFVFIGARKGLPLGKNTFFKLLDAMGQNDITTHGFRSSFRTWAANMTNFPSDICEVALSHAVGGKTQAAYQRGDLLEKRRVMMKAWAKYCATPRRDATVTDIGAVRKSGKRGG
jgi:integrase